MRTQWKYIDHGTGWHYWWPDDRPETDPDDILPGGWKDYE